MTCRALILAAGVGSRLMPLTADRPKALVAVGGTSLLEGLLLSCARAGIDEAVVVTGYRRDAIDSFVRERQLPIAVRTVFNDAYDSLGNAWSVYVAREALAGHDFVKLDGDLVLDDSIISGLVAAHDNSALCIDARAELDAEAMKAQLDGTGRVKALGKWLGVDQSSGESIGVEKIVAADAPALFEAIAHMVKDEGRGDGYYEDAYHRMLQGGWRLDAHDIGTARWSEIDDAADLERARCLFEPPSSGP